MRNIEAFIGEYASGKSEISINRALQLHNLGRKVTIVDLDTVEPFYTLRPIKNKLENQGLTVVSWETHETMGLGETGSIMKPEMRWVLKRQSDIILDVGYGVQGAKIFNLVEGASENKELKVYVVVNTCRPMTSDSDKIINYIKTLGQVDGIIHNSHLGSMTDKETVTSGQEIVKEAAQDLNLPIIATAVDKNHLQEIGDLNFDHEIWAISRYMENSMW